MNIEMFGDIKVFERPAWLDKRFIGWFYFHGVRERYYIDRGDEQMMVTLCCPSQFFTIKNYKEIIRGMPLGYKCDYWQQNETIFLMIRYVSGQYIDNKSFGEKLQEIMVYFGQCFPEALGFTNTVLELLGNGDYRGAVYKWWYYDDEKILFTSVTLLRSLLSSKDLYKIPRKVFSGDNFFVKEVSYPRDGQTLQYKLIGHGFLNNTSQVKNRIERLIDHLISNYN